MKTGIWILTICLSASAWALTPAPQRQASAPGAKPSGATAELKTAAAPPRAAAHAKLHRATLHSAKSHRAKLRARRLRRSAAASAHARLSRKRMPAKPATASKLASAEKPSVHHDRRDPFVSPIVERSRLAATCTGAGKHCLYIGDISLRGIVESANGVIAVVVNGPHTYFLRAHDPLADGEVVRITSNAIILRQRSYDMLGRPVEHEVIRKIGTPS